MLPPGLARPRLLTPVDPSRSLVDAPVERVRVGTAFVPRVFAMPPRRTFTVAIRIEEEGRAVWKSLGRITTTTDGSARLPVIRHLRPGEFPLRLSRPKAASRYLVIEAVRRPAP